MAKTPEEEAEAAKALADAAKALADAAEAEEEKADVPEDDDLDKDDVQEEDDDAPDFEALLKNEQTLREKAEHDLKEAEKAIINAKRRKKNKSGDEDDEEDPDEDDVEDDDKPVTQGDLRRAQEKVQKEANTALSLELVKTISSSENEQKAILAIHANRIWPASIPLTQQLEESKAIANRKKTSKDIREAQRALKGKDGADGAGTGGHQDGSPRAEPKMSAQDKQAIIASGFKLNSSTARYEKTLPNGRVLVQDPKTKKTFMLPKSK